MDCELINGGLRDIPSVMLVDAYDVFEEAVEAVIDTASAFAVSILPSERVLLTVETDSEINDTDIIGKDLHGMKLASSFEDDTQLLTLVMGGEGSD